MSLAIQLEKMVPAKPAFELVDDRLSQKVSPQYAHARLQSTLATLMTAWAKGRGRVGTEWRFTFVPVGDRIASLVPDVAYLSYERLPRERRAEAELPQLAPDVAVEILSPDDWRQQVDRKTKLYLAGRTALVIEVDPQKRTLTTHDATGSTTYAETDVVVHPALPGLLLDLREIFALDE